MKLNAVDYARPSQNINYTENNKYSKKNTPSFGNLGVGLATFIENNGFLGEFLTIDTIGMMAPRTVQGYLRNKDDLGHLNYKAGREEMVRELLSGPAFFYVPLIVLTAAGILRGKSAKVQVSTLEKFKDLLQKTGVDLKNADSTKQNFVNTVVEDAFKGYKKETHIIDKIKELMNKTVKEENSPKGIINKLKYYYNQSKANKQIRKEAVELMTSLNKANGKFINNANQLLVNGEKFDISTLLKDMQNYLNDFTNKAAKTNLDKTAFIEKFHKNAKNLRNITNILAVAALSAFLVVIPKLYQVDKKFPGTDGLTTGNENNNAQTPENKNEKEAV